MSRIDKYDPIDGGFRAPLAEERVTSAAHQLAKGAALDVNGRVITTGIGATGFKGVLVTTKDRHIGDPVDIMTDGELVEFPGVAGTNYFIDAATGLIVAGTGAQTSTAPAAAGSKYVGFTVEATRLVVRVPRP